MINIKHIFSHFKPDVGKISRNGARLQTEGFFVGSRKELIEIIVGFLLIIFFQLREQEVDNGLLCRPSPPPTPSPASPAQSRGDPTFVWTMPALWSLKCSRVAAISISLAPATERELEPVQSSSVIQLTSVNLSLGRLPLERRSD